MKQYTIITKNKHLQLYEIYLSFNYLSSSVYTLLLSTKYSLIKNRFDPIQVFCREQDIVAILSLVIKQILRIKQELPKFLKHIYLYKTYVFEVSENSTCLIWFDGEVNIKTSILKNEVKTKWLRRLLK